MLKKPKLGPRIFAFNWIFLNFLNILSLGKQLNVTCSNNRFPIGILGTTCVQIFRQNVTWDSSSQHCKQIGGSLLKIKDRRKNNIIQRLVNGHGSTVYIGLSKEANERVYKWIGESDEAKYMGKGSFDYDAPTQQCVTMSHATQPYWNSGRCEEKFGYICEHSPAQLCPPGWDVNISGGTCIKAIEIPKTWFDARAHCKNLGGDLAVALDREMDQFLVDYTYKRPSKFQTHTLPFWIGLNNVNSRDHYKWLDNVVDGLNYTHWYVEPLNWHGVSCVDIFDHGFGFWVPLNCTLQRPFLCEKLADCRFERYGMECPKRCTSSVCVKSQEFCNTRNGMCQNGCEENKYGAGCSKDCSPHCGGSRSLCHFTNGTCLSNCKHGYVGDQCNTACSNNTYGANCLEPCSTHCGGADKACDNIDGFCKHGCQIGYIGSNCGTACSNLTYGHNCSKTCSPGCRNKTCDFRDGFCMFGCVTGYEGFHCTIMNDRRTVYSFAAIVTTTIFACLVVVLCLLSHFTLEKMKLASNSPSAAEPIERMEGEELEEYHMVVDKEIYEEEEETRSRLSFSVLGDMVSGILNKVKRGRFDNDYTYTDNNISSEVASLASTLEYGERSTSNEALPRVGRKKKKKKQETIVSDADSEVSSRKIELKEG